MVETGWVITREKLDIYCHASQKNCPAGIGYDTLCDWRENIMEKGGPLARNEHTAICKEITKEVANHFRIGSRSYLTITGSGSAGIEVNRAGAGFN